ncbi:DUF6214 family protein [Streptomyces shenzhenensis]|uniref:DUF6214 family protein n=1 Tax=Streptomyces shenzhenensis TaxID=943815 RepID=UPI0033C91BAD
MVRSATGYGRRKLLVLNGQVRDAGLLPPRRARRVGSTVRRPRRAPAPSVGRRCGPGPRGDVCDRVRAGPTARRMPRGPAPLPGCGCGSPLTAAELRVRGHGRRDRPRIARAARPPRPRRQASRAAVPSGAARAVSAWLASVRSRWSVGRPRRRPSPRSGCCCPAPSRRWPW